MEKNINKKLFAGILAISAGCLLASCDPIEAVPANYTEPLISSTVEGETIDFEDNILGTIYDSIESDTKTKVIEKVLKTITDKQFGTYADFKEGNLSEKEYFKGFTEYKKEHFVSTVCERISEFFYNEVVSGSYNDELGMFSEAKMYNAHRQELYDMTALPVGFENKFFVTASFDKKEDFYPHGSSEVLKGDYSDYIEKKVYPQILKDILVEDYIYRSNPLALGRSYGVYASYVKVAYDEESHISVRKLMKNYSSTQIENGNADFEIVTEAIKGFKDFSAASGVTTISSDATDLLDKTYGASELVSVSHDAEYQGISLLTTGQSFHKSTKIGELIESYNKAIKAEDAGRFPIEEDKTELDKFTSEGKSKEYGLMQKLVSLAKEDYTEEGWFVKSTGAGELPSNISDRLFNIRVSQQIDAETLEEDSYLRKVGENKFVIAKDADKVENNPYNYVYDDGASACWIAKVEEAVSPAKFNSKSATYLPDARREELGRAVAEVLATKSNYVKEAYTEYLNKYQDVIFYDSSLYDYFQSEYPDLDIFDDED